MYQSTFTEFKGDLEYRISESDNGTWDVFLKNNDLAYYPIILYRYEILFDLTDSIVFRYAGRVKLSGKDTTFYDTGGGFDCGTDLMYAFIRPYESFRMRNIQTKDLLPDLGDYVHEMKEKGVDLTHDSTITCQLYLPILSFGEEASRVYSNEITLKTNLLYEQYALFLKDQRHATNELQSCR
jgi:hypothetical protein